MTGPTDIPAAGSDRIPGIGPDRVITSAPFTRDDVPRSGKGSGKKPAPASGKNRPPKRK